MRGVKFREVISGTVKKEKHCSTWDYLLKKYPKTNIKALSKNEPNIRNFRLVDVGTIK